MFRRGSVVGVALLTACAAPANILQERPLEAVGGSLVATGVLTLSHGVVIATGERPRGGDVLFAYSAIMVGVIAGVVGAGLLGATLTEDDLFSTDLEPIPLSDLGLGTESSTVAPTRVTPARTSTEAVDQAGSPSESAPAPAPLQPREDRSAPPEIEVRTLEALGGSEIDDAQLPEADVDASAPVETGVFDLSQVLATVTAQKRAIASCYDQSLKHSAGLSGKLEVEIVIEPSGRVSRATVLTEKFAGTELAKCVSSTLLTWRFPPFEGGPESVVLPFHFQAGY